MKTEDVPLDIKEIFEKKKVVYKPSDIASMRYLVRQFVEYILESQMYVSEQNQNQTMEKWCTWDSTVRDR